MDTGFLLLLAVRKHDTVMHMTKEILVIRPFNKVYIACTLLAALIAAGLCRWVSVMEIAEAQTGIRHFSEFLVGLLLVYRTALLFDRGYADAAYENGKINIWNELLLFPCNVIAMIGLAGTLLNSRLLLSFAFFYALCPAAALCFPSVGYEKYSILEPRIFAFYLYHHMILAFPFLMVVSGVYVPEYADVIPALLLYSACSLFALTVNIILVRTGLNSNANYFFNRIPDGNPVMEKLYGVIPVPFLFTVPMMLLHALLNYGVVWLVRMLVL